MSEYVAMQFPNSPVTFNLRLFTPKSVAISGLSKEASNRLLSRAGLYVDALIQHGGGVILIEAKVEMESQALGQLLIYKELIKETPGYVYLTDEAITLRLVSPIKKPWIDDVLAKYDIEVDHWAPKWIIDYLAELRVRRSF